VRYKKISGREAGNIGQIAKINIWQINSEISGR
jgi:hypothetical protein